MGQDLGGGAARGGQGVQGGFDGAVGVAQDAGEGLLVVAVDHRVVFGQQAPQANGRGHLAVGQVVDDLARRPLVGFRVQLGVRDALQRGENGLVALRITFDERLALRIGHQVRHMDTNDRMQPFMPRGCS